MHSDEWLDGIPPESNSAMMSHTPLRKRLVKICGAGIWIKDYRPVCYSDLERLCEQPCPKPGHEDVVGGNVGQTGSRQHGSTGSAKAPSALAWVPIASVAGFAHPLLAP